jgi:hypothetical protein
MVAATMMSRLEHRALIRGEGGRMKVLLAVFSGSLAAAVFAFVVTWILSPDTVHTFSAVLQGGPGMSLAVTAAALIVGAYVAVKIHPSLETLSGYGTVQLFFGPALVRHFWLGDAAWYAVVALLMVLPLTLIGGLLGGRQCISGRLETL